jgi:hypothetical protein
VVPLLVALLAFLGVFAAARRWRRRPARAAAAPRGPNPADEERLERELAAYDRGLRSPDGPSG